MGCGSSTAVELTPHDQEVVVSNPVWWSTFFSFQLCVPKDFPKMKL